MQFATTFRQSKWLDRVDEVHFDTIHSLFESYEKYPDATYRRVLEVRPLGTIEFNGEPTTIDTYVQVRHKYPECILNFMDVGDLVSFVNTVTESENVSYFYPVNTYNLLNAVIRCKVCDILIDEPLTFDLENVNDVIKRQLPECRIHVVPCFNRNNQIHPDEDYIHHFWLLPQHVYLNEDFIDVINLIDKDKVREQRLLDIYIDKEEYHNYLMVLFGYYDEEKTHTELKADFVDEEMAIKRMNCKQRCMSSYPVRCHYCDLQKESFDVIRAARQRMRNQPTTSTE